MKLNRLVVIFAAPAAVVLTAAALPTWGSQRAPHPKVIVIGFDGLDPRLCERLMDAGELPNFDRMRRAGGYRRLATSIPPQSPVAWATFIVGADAGVHGIFDFLVRDPTGQYIPRYSAAETKWLDEGWEVGGCRIPLTFWPFRHKPPRTVLHRDGVPFWDYLDEAGVPTWLYRMPVNYPPSPSRGGHVRCLAGMGVADLLGEYGGGYQFFSEKTVRSRMEPGGMRSPLVFTGDAATAALRGPEDTYCNRGANTMVDFHVYRDPDGAAARIDLHSSQQCVCIPAAPVVDPTRAAADLAWSVRLGYDMRPRGCLRAWESGLLDN